MCIRDSYWIEYLTYSSVHEMIGHLNELSALLAMENFSEADEVNLNRLLNFVSNKITERRYFLSTSPLAIFVKCEFESSPEIANIILWIATNSNSAIGNSRAEFMAAFALMEFERGISKKSATSIRTSLTALADTMEDSTTEFRMRSDGLLEQLNGAIESRLNRCLLYTSRCV